MYPLRNGWLQLLSWKKEFLYSEKNCSLRLITVTYKEKYSFRNKWSTLDHSLLLWVYLYDFAKIFLRLSVIAAVCYFSVYKLIGWDSKSTTEYKKKEWKCSKLTIKKVESHHGVFIVNFEHISHSIFSVSILNFEWVNVCVKNQSIKISKCCI